MELVDGDDVRVILPTSEPAILLVPQESFVQMELLDLSVVLPSVDLPIQIASTDLFVNGVA